MGSRGGGRRVRRVRRVAGSTWGQRCRGGSAVLCRRAGHLVLGLDDRVLESVRISRGMRTRWVRSGVSASDAPSAEIAPRPRAAAWTACGARLEPPRAQGRAAVALGRTGGSSARLSAARASPPDKLSTLNSPPHLPGVTGQSVRGWGWGWAGEGGCGPTAIRPGRGWRSLPRRRRRAARSRARCAPARWRAVLAPPPPRERSRRAASRQARATRS